MLLVFCLLLFLGSLHMHGRQACAGEKSAQLYRHQAAESLEEAQSANSVELETLRNLLQAHHLDCDYVLKYFCIRQKSRAEEMSAITGAKAILFGVDFK